MFPNLHTYDISHHGIETLTYNDLRLDNLVTFIASHNKLTSIPAGLFRHAPKLWGIFLDFNHITTLEAGAFSEVKETTTISLDHNPIRRIDGKIFLPMNLRLNKLSITWDNVEEFDISDMNGLYEFRYDKLFDAFAFGKDDTTNGGSYQTKHYKKDCFANLKVFKASGAGVNNVMEFVEILGPSLEELDVSSNFIGQLNGNAFDRFSNLHYLNLSSTNLTSFDFNDFHNRAALQVLDISYNNINGIDFAPSVGVFENLETLNVRGNRVSNIPDIFPKLCSLEMSFRVESHSN